METDELMENTSTDVRLKPSVENHLLDACSLTSRHGLGAVSVGTQPGRNLVVGESGADWALGIAFARRTGPNLALVTQWAGEAAIHFAGRVGSRIAKREGFQSIVVVCNDDDGEESLAARQQLVSICARRLPADSGCTVTFLWSGTAHPNRPLWAGPLEDWARKQEVSVRVQGARNAA